MVRVRQTDIHVGQWEPKVQGENSGMTKVPVLSHCKFEYFLTDIHD